MALVLDISTSAEFWRQVYPGDRAPAKPCGAAPDTCACAYRDIEPLIPPWMSSDFLDSLGGVIRVLAFNVSERRDSSRHIVHVWGERVPEGSFYELKGDVFIASPEFIFLVSASLLSRTQLVALGCELCGLYGFNAREERGFRKRTVPLLTVGRLQRYLSGARGVRGCRAALSAIPHIVELSASPMETFDALALCLPYRLGGYGLHKPLMNHKIALTPRAARIAKRNSCYPDMCWLSAKLDVEHHGRLDHSKLDDRVSDRARVNALKEMEFEVIELTRDQVGDLQAFEYIAERIARLVGKRLRKDCLGATEPRLTLRRDVFAWNQSSGRLR